MSDIEKLEGMYKKEMELYRKHKEKAEQLKMRIDEEKGQAIMKSVKRMNLSPHEFKQFEKALHNESNVRKLINQEYRESEIKSNQPVIVQDITVRPEENAIFQCYEKNAEEYRWEFYSILDKSWEPTDRKPEFSVYEETDCLGRQVSCLSIPGKEEYAGINVRCTAVWAEGESKTSEGCLYLYDGEINKISIPDMEAEAGEYLSNLSLEVLVTPEDGTQTSICGLQNLAFCVNEDEQESSVYDETSSITTETYTKTFHELPYYPVKNGEQSVDVKLRMDGKEYNAPLKITGKDTTPPQPENIRAEYQVSNQEVKSTKVVIYASATDNYAPPSELRYAFSKKAKYEKDKLTWYEKLPLEADITENGTYYFLVKDTSENIACEELEIITVDMKAPVIEAVTLNADAEKGMTIEVTASDKTELEYCFHLTTDVRQDWQKDPVYHAAINGEYLVEVRDAAGNCSKDTITVSEIDNEPPVITGIQIKTD